MTHVDKIDILTGHEEIGDLHFDLEIFLIAYLSKKKKKNKKKKKQTKKNMHFLKTCTINCESITYCPTIFC